MNIYSGKLLTALYMQHCVYNKQRHRQCMLGMRGTWTTGKVWDGLKCPLLRNVSDPIQT